ncbi:MAG: hypothetical protein KJ820_16395 [Bacteroidetes bacterium]|nr:hypothetical protein [Bacteroidota bacterium]
MAVKKLDEQVEELIDRWRLRLNLHEWRIDWDWVHGDMTFDAQTTSFFGQRRAHININDDCLGDRGRLRSAVVHELVHCRIAEMSDSVLNSGLQTALGETAWTIWYENWRRHMEMEVEALAVIFLGVWKDGDLKLT